MVACRSAARRGWRAGYCVCDSTGCADDIAYVGEVSAQTAEGREGPAARRRFAMNRAVSKVGDQQAPVRRKPETGVLLACGQNESRDVSRVPVNLTNHFPQDIRDIDRAIARNSDVGYTFQ